MIQFVYGRSGTGKSTLVTDMIVGDLKKGIRNILIVPEQQAIEAERRIADRLSAEDDVIPSADSEVLNFSRLANRVFRTFGGLSYNYINKGGRALIMWRAICALNGMLSEFADKASVRDRTFITMLLDTVRDFKTFNITPSALENAYNELDDGALKRKVGDLSLIFSAYDRLLKNDYSDPYDDLSLLTKTLEEHNFFHGYNVYIDSFTAFTPQEINVIRQIFIQSDNTVVTFGALPADRQLAFDGIKRTSNTLRRLAADLHCDMKNDIILKEIRRFSNNELIFLSEHIWDIGDKDTYDGSCEHIKIVECSDIYSEAEAAARDIAKKVMGGSRYRDFVIMARDISDYEGIIDATLEKLNLPYFMSVRTELTSKPQVKLILSALNILSGGWRASDVITYLKTGLTGISSDECNILENYVTTWNISGQRWYDEYEWNCNPRGYSMIYTDADTALLSRLNELRSRVASPLKKLSDAFTENASVRNISAEIYEFLCSQGIPEHLELEAKEDTPVGGESVLLWNLIMESLDQFVIVAGDNSVTADEYSTLFSMILSETDMGHLPASIDNITLGNAAMLRVGNIKHVYILGANDGVFPKNISDNGIFCGNDRESLASIGLELPAGSDFRMTDELMFFHMAVSCASESVTVSYITGDLAGRPMKPSSAVLRMKKMFPELQTVKDRLTPPLDLLWNYDCAFEYAGMLYHARNDTDSNAIGKALYDIYSADPQYAARIKSLMQPLSAGNEKLSDTISAQLFDGDIALTQSRLDSYAKCPFSYACQYILKLSEKKRAAFRSTDIGTFVHRILEVFMRMMKTESSVNSKMTDEQISLILDDIISEYMCGLTKFYDSDKRLRHLIIRLKKTSILLIRSLLNEFAQSKFSAEFFELAIEDGGQAEPLKIKLPDGKNVYVYGVIDRVDTYRRGDDVYVRIIDYKTGVKDFSMSDISLGINLQMLLYLFSIWQNPSEKFKEAVGISGHGQILPAGMLYFSAGSPEIALSCDKSFEETYSEAVSAVSRSGLLISDTDVLSAMDEKLNGLYIPVKIKKDGNFTNASPVKTIEEFAAIMQSVSTVVSEIAMEMKKGDMSVRPLHTIRHNACAYCPYHAVCRHDTAEKSDKKSDSRYNSDGGSKNGQ